MILKISGHDIPSELLEIIPVITDHARLLPHEVVYEQSIGEVRIPITRYPLIKRRMLLPSKYDHRNPQKSLVTVRNVISCEISEEIPPELEEKVHLMFGIQCQVDQIYLCSAEEERGQPCYSLTIKFSELDVEIVDLGSNHL